jgi:predicted DNA-binding antitoxin AbrB/MazE fold protein
MTTTIRARIKGGVIEPLEQVDLPEGQDILVTILTAPSVADIEVFHLSAGRWQGTFEPETLIEKIYADRLVSTRSAPIL